MFELEGGAAEEVAALMWHVCLLFSLANSRFFLVHQSAMLYLEFHCATLLHGCTEISQQKKKLLSQSMGAD